MTKYYVNQMGDYIGGFEGAPPPADAPEIIEVPGPPPVHAAQRWDGLAWGPPPPDPSTPRRGRVAELLAIPRSHWTAAQYRELLQLVAQSLPRFEGDRQQIPSPYEGEG